MKNKVYVIGMGGGDLAHMTHIAIEKMQQAETLIGAKRHLDLPENDGKKKVYMEDGMQAMLSVIKERVDDEQLAVLVSGDTGFFSLLRYIKKNIQNIDIEVYTSPSSISLMFAKLGMMWDDAKLISGHGVEIDIVKEVKQNRKVALLTDCHTTPKKIAEQLYFNGIQNKVIAIGERLTYEDEKITKLSIKEACNIECDKLCVMVITDEDVYI